MAEQRTDAAKEKRKLYSDPRWRGPHGIRHQALRRDLYTCQMCGRLLTGKHRKGRPSDDNAPDVDHIADPGADPARFFDLANTQSLCHWPCHAKRKQEIERRGYDTAVGVDGFPIDPAHPANARR